MIFFFKKRFGSIMINLLGTTNELFMNSSINEFYQKNFDEVIFLKDSSSMPWDRVEEFIPDFPKGWYELICLDPEDRIEFHLGYWQRMLPYHPHVHAFISYFFSDILDVFVVLTKKTKGDFFECEMVYEKKNCFFRGGAPLFEEEIDEVNKEFHDILPRDYRAFLKIHDGFAKGLDAGLIKAMDLKNFYRNFYHNIVNENRRIFLGNHEVDPGGLIPFYQGFGHYSFQCFYRDWYPQDEMGNVYFSGEDNTISNYTTTTLLAEVLAFQTFLDWLIYYLEDIEV